MHLAIQNIPRKGSFLEDKLESEIEGMAQSTLFFTHKYAQSDCGAKCMPLCWKRIKSGDDLI